MNLSKQCIVTILSCGKVNGCLQIICHAFPWISPFCICFLETFPMSLKRFLHGQNANILAVMQPAHICFQILFSFVFPLSFSCCCCCLHFWKKDGVYYIFPSWLQPHSSFVSLLSIITVHFKKKNMDGKGLFIIQTS